MYVNMSVTREMVTVSNRRSQMSWRTGRRNSSEMPKSPRTKSQIQFAYWTTNGSSR